MLYLQRAVVVAVRHPDAAKVGLALEDGEVDSLPQQPQAGQYAYNAAADHSNVDDQLHRPVGAGRHCCHQRTGKAASVEIEFGVLPSPFPGLLRTARSQYRRLRRQQKQVLFCLTVIQWIRSHT